MKPEMRPTLHRWFGSLSLVALLGAAALLGACAGTATTRVTVTPPDQAPVCQPQAALKASVLWRTQWRADQKDVTDREAAAAQGIQRFFADGGCFTLATVARTQVGGSAFDVPAGSDRLVVLTVRELGPVVKLLSSAALVDGGTEVVVDVAVYRPGRREPQQQFSIHWQDGGPGVVKGVQTLPADLAAALKAGLGAH
ncbi:MAG: hypothetical protein BWX79_00276 [Alphaproteobacteria bacterium ADurb.Bin100]|jgi:hypothetical protein|nr:MAG: hypothetical protein BWX79_00276 [Alphaproteobacteria bacterium ADurb.Bin100]